MENEYNYEIRKVLKYLNKAIQQKEENPKNDLIALQLGINPSTYKKLKKDSRNNCVRKLEETTIDKICSYIYNVDPRILTKMKFEDYEEFKEKFKERTCYIKTNWVIALPYACATAVAFVISIVISIISQNLDNKSKPLMSMFLAGGILYYMFTALIILFCNSFIKHPEPVLLEKKEKKEEKGEDD